MKNYKIFTLLVMIPVSVAGQSVSFSQSSVKLWGMTGYTGKAEIEYKSLSIVTMMIRSPGNKALYIEPTATNFLGAFYSPASFDTGLIYGSVGAGFFNKKFPSDTGSYFHARFEIGMKLFQNLSISYSHISNVYTGLINPGVDNFNLKIHIQ